MSHQPERKEKDCLNCGTIVNGRYCHICGQENIVNHQSFWGLTKHFVYDIFHFDGKFFDTLKHLILRPGKVPANYIAGKRGKYLDPIRMYLFTSAVFFLVFFSVKDVSKVFDGEGKTRLNRTERFEQANKVYSKLYKDSNNRALIFKLGLLLDTSQTLRLSQGNPAQKNDSFGLNVGKNYYLLQPRKDSVTFNVLNKNNKRFENIFKKRWEERKSKYGDDQGKMLGEIFNDFLHKVPYLLFLSLPIFALILKLLYVRRKNFFYSDHAIFTLYHYIFSFILLLIYFGVEAIYKSTGWSAVNWLTTAIMICWPLYLLLGMRNFYQQGWGKTLVKFLLVDLLGIITLLVLFIIFLLLSFIF